MTTLSQKDEQIVRQAEEIESLNRKIESLEKELQRHIDPDSGEIRPSLHGEKALIQQIATLQKQLDDCLENERWIMDERLERRICGIVASLFMPQDMFTDWFTFRDELLQQEDCVHLFTSRDFRQAMSIMNDFIPHLNIGDTDFKWWSETAQVLIHNSAAKGWDLMTEGLEIIERNGSDSVVNFQDLRICLQTIHRCVKMYHEYKGN